MDIRTEAQREAALATDAPVVALIVGTSTYPHADPDKLLHEKRRLGVAPLTSAARSASWFAGWLTDTWSERDRLASLHLLLAPAPGELVDERVADAWEAGGKALSTLANFKAAFRAIKNDTRDDAARAVIYLAGHGVEVTGRSATVLLHDYLDPMLDDVYSGAVNSIGCHEALSDGQFALTQFWFIDSCRDASTVEREYEHLHPGWAPGDRKRGSANVAPLYMAAAPWTSALAEKNGRSLFNQALEWTLSGKVSRQLPGTDEWGVQTTDLAEHLGPHVQLLAADGGEDQFVIPTGIVAPAVVHRFEHQPAPDASREFQYMGTLRLDASVESQHLRSMTPFRVTDEDGQLVAEPMGPQSIEVPVGNYTVSMRQPDGHWVNKETVLAPAETSTVEFEYSFPATVRDWDGDPNTEQVQFLEVEEAKAYNAGPGAWSFTPNDHQPPRVPRATYRVGGRTMIVSLPINPTSGFPECAAVIVVDPALGVRAGFAPERKVSRTLQTALEMDRLGESTIELFRESSDLLLRKYEDPVGAALGGLMLHRIGQLRDRYPWVANLARYFAWLPDGLALQAALLSASEDDDERSEGLDLLLEASRHRPMFYDGLALIVDLLQRWPDGAKPAQRLEHLGFAGPILTKAVRSSLVLLTDHGEWK